MNDEQDSAAVARQIVDAGLYMVLATSDLSGQPWASPVYYAPSGYREFFWVSAPEATHSRNLRDRREVGIVIFDSRAPINTGQGVYISGVAHELPAHECDLGMAIFSKRAVSHGGEAWTVEDVREPARHRLYQATAEAIYVLDEHDQRVEVRLP
jgi:pyridoxamine 5'-phosphate oxidase-like protein